MNSVALGLVLGQLVHLAPSGYTGTLTITDRTEARTRTSYRTTPDRPQPESRLGFDVDNVLGTTISLDGRRTSFGVSYGARFTLFDVGGATNSLDVMQFGRLGASWFDRKLRLTLGIDGGIGNQNSASLAAPVTLGQVGVGGAPPPPPTAPPVNYVLPPQRLYTGSLRASLGASYAFDRRWTTGANASAGIGGGFDYISQQANPPNRNVGAGVFLGYQLGKNDLTNTSVSGSYTYVLATPPGPGLPDSAARPGGKYISLGLFQTYSHNFNARTVGSAGLGFSHVRDAAITDNGTFFGSALLGLGYSKPTGRAVITSAGSLSVGTLYNPIVAQIQQTASASFIFTWTVRKWTAGATLGTATSIPFDTPGSSRTLSGALGVGYLAGEVVQLQAGVRTSAQVLPATAGQDLPPSYGAFLAMVIAARPMRL